MRTRKALWTVALLGMLALAGLSSAQNATRPGGYGPGLNSTYQFRGGLGGFGLITPILVIVIILLLVIITLLAYKLKTANQNSNRRRGK